MPRDNCGIVAPARRRALLASMSESTSQQNPALPDRPKFFRQEALVHHANPDHEAAILELDSGWLHWSYWLLLAVCVAAFAYAMVGRLNTYASGTAVIRSVDRIEVNAHAAGTVEDVLVRPGQRVHAGQPLVHLYSAAEAANLARIESELEQLLVRVLLDPSDEGARGQLAGLRAQREQAQASMEERISRAPRDAIVSHVGVRKGQSLQPGDLMFTLTRTDTGFRVLAVLPGQHRPLLRPGMRMRLELRGYPYAYQTVTLDSVSDHVVGPAEMRRYLPQSIADAFEATGPMVFVEASLEGYAFVVDDRVLEYHDGMFAQAEVVVRSESIPLRLIPGLRQLL
jgi:membrane fusion protein, multidrug efflux system